MDLAIFAVIMVVTNIDHNCSTQMLG